MKPLNELVATVAKIADNEGFTALGLLDYLRDLDRHPEVYGTDKARDRIEERLFAGTGIGVEDVTEKVCGLAMSYHLQHVRDSIKRWQAEADAAGVPVAYVLVGDNEMGYDAVMRRRWGGGTVEEAVAGSLIPERRASTKSKGQVVLGYEAHALVSWMGRDGWDLADAREALAMYGGECVDADLLTWLKLGREGHSPLLPASVQDKLREALE